MAKNEKNNGIRNSELKEVLRFVAGVLLCGLAAYTVIVLFSYLFTWHSDQSLLQHPEAGSPDTSVANHGGKIGFWWAHLLVGHYFGLAAFFIPLLIFLSGCYFLKIKWLPLFKSLIVSLSGLILFSVFLGFVFGYTPWKSLFGNGLGGAHGFWVSRWLVSLLGAAGTALLLVFLLLLWGILINKRFIHFLKKLVRRIFTKKKKEVAIPEEEHGNDTPDEQPNDAPDDDVDDGDEDDVPFEVKIEEEEQPETEADEDAEDDEPAPTPVVVVNPPAGEDAGEEIPAEEFSPFDPTLDLPGYKRPTLDLLDDHKSNTIKVNDAELERNKNKIVKTLNDYKIGIEKIIATIGPTVTLYEIVPKAGVRIASIKRLEDDIALSLAAIGVRIIAPIPGKGTVGIEVPNEHPETVSMLSVIRSSKFQEAKYDLPVVLGKTISNETHVFDLAKMPHLLVAGATGQGKSVGLNAILTSLLYRKHPAELKLVLVDPKKVELTLYAKIERHFLAKLPDADEAIITDTQKVVYTLKSLCKEMDERYDLLKMAQVRNLREYNEKFVNRRLNPVKGHRYMPFIVVVIDEFADLLMTAGREVEDPIARLAQLARAVGIHLVIATQRPTTNIITGLIKANFPARIAFRVISSIDSRTILDSTGANQLIGRGDMLVSANNEMIRVQCAFVDTPEVERICEFIGSQRGYEHAFYLPEYTGEESGDGNGSTDIDLSHRDKMFEEAARVVVQHQQGSTSLIQRKLNLGYNRAGRIMDQLEAAGIVGAFEGSKARQVLISDFDTLDRKLKTMNDD
ncbi:MAG: DNA translocase FtsK [Prevotellaceae bacterium]|jgi:S-DNA-T family DNA segregation ATPase FtsK/SpoIIIE|nr:DNA translocase FtsK [Prevotellaceae bacterium]